MITYTVRLVQIVNLETGEKTKRFDPCMLKVNDDATLSIKYMDGHGTRTTTRLRKVYDHVERWPGGVVNHKLACRTQNSEYYFEQNCFRSDYDYEIFEELPGRLQKRLDEVLPLCR